MINELATKFSFRGSLDPLSKYDGKLTAIKKGFLALTAVSATAFIALNKNASVINRNAELSIFSRHLRLNHQDVQSLGYAATQSGSSISALKQSLSSLDERIGKSVIYGDEKFLRYGIAPINKNGAIKTATELLYDVNKLFNSREININQKRLILGDLGIDKSLVGTLSLSTKKLSALMEKRRALNILTDDEIKQNEKLKRQYDDLGITFSSYADKLSLKTLPAINSLLNKTKEFTGYGFQVAESVSEWSSENKILASSIAGIATLLTKSGRIIGGFLLRLSAPLAVIAGALLVIDDFQNHKNGNKSFMADYTKDGSMSDHLPNFLKKPNEWYNKANKSLNEYRQNLMQSPTQNLMPKPMQSPMPNQKWFKTEKEAIDYYNLKNIQPQPNNKAINIKQSNTTEINTTDNNIVEALKSTVDKSNNDLLKLQSAQ